jgi:hypothetical protein
VKQLGTVFACCAIGVVTLTLTMWMLPERSPGPRWSEDVRARVLDDRIKRGRRYGEVIREVDEAVARQGLPLREAAARLVAAAEQIDPDQLRLIDVLELHEGSLVEKCARMIVKRFRAEIRDSGNPNNLPKGLLARLERELDEMARDNFVGRRMALQRKRGQSLSLGQKSYVFARWERDSPLFRCKPRRMVS